jgi:hypothetical protein
MQRPQRPEGNDREDSGEQKTELPFLLMGHTRNTFDCSGKLYQERP